MSVLRELRILLRLRVLQLFFLSSLLVLLAAIAFVSQTTVRDPDIWWHLKVGDWIVQHRAVPFVGIFSRTAETRPWIAYSWGYEVLLSRAYAWFGLVGVGVFGDRLALGVIAAGEVHAVAGAEPRGEAGRRRIAHVGLWVFHQAALGDLDER